ncbi:MAG TPA: bacillithiol system redox-active protein YtxJ [Chitinophagales bacterium]|nr:bacillithiol system redox-active protein YtxJ [Chitinophagales bacterium]
MTTYKTLNDIAQLDELDNQSRSRLQLIFKHSTRCGVSSMAKRGLDMELRQPDGTAFDIYYLDLIQYRAVSNHIATRYGIQHESPQLLVIKDGRCIYHASHDDVSLHTALAAA